MYKLFYSPGSAAMAPHALLEELGVAIAIENVWNKFLLSPLEAAAFVDQFRTPAVRWHFDVGNVIDSGSYIERDELRRLIREGTSEHGNVVGSRRDDSVDRVDCHRLTCSDRNAVHGRVADRLDDAKGARGLARRLALLEFALGQHPVAALAHPHDGDQRRRTAPQHDAACRQNRCPQDRALRCCRG